MPRSSRSPVAWWIRSLALATILLGCQPPEGRFACARADECPLGWSCVDGLCRSRPGPDAGPTDAADTGSADAASDGAP